MFYPTEKNARVQALSLLPLIRPRFAHPPSPEGEGSHSKVKPPLKGKAVAPKSSLPLRRHEARDAGGIPERCRTQRGGRGVPRRMILPRMGCRISSPLPGSLRSPTFPRGGKAAAPKSSLPLRGKAVAPGLSLSLRKAAAQKSCRAGCINPRSSFCLLLIRSRRTNRN